MSEVLRLNIPLFVRLMMDLGIHIRVGRDFEEFNRICEGVPEKGELSAAFNTSLYPDDQRTGLWMIGLRNNDEVVLTQAIRTLNLNGKNLEQFLTDNFAMVAPGGVEIDTQKSSFNLSQSAKDVKGVVTYQGDVWLKGGPQSVRGGSLATLATRLLLIMAYLRWKPDYMTGIQGDQTVFRGLAIREGYYRIEQSAFTAHVVGEEQTMSGSLVWMTAQEAQHNLRVSPQKLFEILEPKAHPSQELKKVLAAQGSSSVAASSSSKRQASA